MRNLIVILFAFLAVTHAHAANEPVIGSAPPSWVAPAEVNLETPADGQAMRMLLLDRQLHFGEEGDSTYSRSVVRIGTSEGLAAGSVSLSWNPETETIAVHRLLIHRGATTIDALKTQTFSILRRESNLEFAMLDGVLTANMQIEGLAIGDVIELETTLVTKNPLLRGMSDHSELGLGLGSFDHLRLRALWPTARPIAWRGLGEFSKPAIKTVGPETELSVDLKQLTPMEFPTGAPMRFLLGRGIEFSEFRTWADVSALMAPLYSNASKLTASSPLKAEIARIKAYSKDPKAQASAALSLIESQVRYVFVGVGLGGLKPEDADVSWQRKFADCKGKTVLLLALLNGLGIEAQPVLVATYGGDITKDRLPSVGAFNHVIVRVVIAGKVYWLDATRTGDTSVELLRTPLYHWALPVQSSGATLVPLAPDPLGEPDYDLRLELDATAGLDAKAKAHAELVLRDDAAYGFHTAYISTPATERDRSLRAYWRQTYDFIEPRTVSESYDPATRILTLNLDGLAELDWQDQNGMRYFEVAGAALGYEPDFRREPGPNADAPFAVPYPFYTRSKLSLRLPDDGYGYRVQGAKVDKVLAGTEYKRTNIIANGVFESQASTRSVALEFSFSEATAAQRPLKELANDHVVVVRSRATTMSALSSAADYTTRGLSKLKNFDNAGAAKDFDAAIALDAMHAAAWSNRGIANYWLGKINDARADFDRAASLAAPDIAVEHGYGLIAFDAGDMPEAVKHMSAAIAIDPGDTFGHFYRGMALAWIDRYDAALADAAELRRLSPNSPMSYELRAQIFMLRGDTDAAIEENTQSIVAAPGEVGRYRARALVLVYAGRLDEADKDFARVLELTRTAPAYIQRSAYRPLTDVAGRRNDLAAALKIAPQSISVLVTLGENESIFGDHEKAMAYLDQALAIDPKSASALTYRGRAYVRAGNLKAAKADFAAVRNAVSGNAGELNNLCWNQATIGVELEVALVDCTASLALNRSAHTLDSRAFVRLRLGQLDAALEDYNEALKMNPRSANSLYGRAIVLASKGLRAEAERDKLLAVRISPLVWQSYENYGLPRP